MSTRRRAARAEATSTLVADDRPPANSAMSVAAVTAVLKDLLDTQLIEQSIATSVGDVAVTALPPDRIAVGADEKNQLNVFMYRITPNTGWRRVPGSPADQPGSRPVVAPLALDLHYLITAYGQHDFVTEVLLGCAVQLLHDTPILAPESIRSSLAESSASAGGASGPLRAALANASLVNQREPISIQPEFLSSEETSKLWSALQARYRPSVTYRVSHVMIESSP